MTCRWCREEAREELVAAGLSETVADLLSAAGLGVVGWAVLCG